MTRRGHDKVARFLREQSRQEENEPSRREAIRLPALSCASYG